MESLAILVARKIATAQRNSPAYVSAIADAATDAKKIVNRVEKECQTTSSGM